MLFMSRVTTVLVVTSRVIVLVVTSRLIVLVKCRLLVLVASRMRGADVSRIIY